MRTRTFGDSALVTSVIRFGGRPTGGDHQGPFDENELEGALSGGFDLGGTLFDTAAVQGWGDGEKPMGRAVRGFREDIVPVTRRGRRWDVDGRGPSISASSALP